MKVCYKFRVWDGAEMHYDNNKNIISLDNNMELKASGDNSVFMQSIGGYGYTGEYKDRMDNLQLLFEGDIVEAWSQGSKGTFIIKKRMKGSPAYMLYPAFQSEKFWNISFSQILKRRGRFIYYDSLRIIGNIYETPELIPSNIKDYE